MWYRKTQNWKRRMIGWFCVCVCETQLNVCNVQYVCACEDIMGKHVILCVCSKLSSSWAAPALLQQRQCHSARRLRVMKWSDRQRDSPVVGAWALKKSPQHNLNDSQDARFLWTGLQIAVQKQQASLLVIQPVHQAPQCQMWHPQSGLNYSKI